MAANDYEFNSCWQIKGTPSDVFPVIANIPDYVHWWGTVYLDVKVIEPGGDNGLGLTCDVLTRGALPYKLRWRAAITQVDFPTGLVIAATGDLVGTGIWIFRPNGELVDLLFKWTVRAEKPLIRNLSGVLKPLFRINHEWAMARGQEGLLMRSVRPKHRSEFDVAR